MKVGLVAGTIRNDKIDEQIREMEYHLSSTDRCDLLCFGETYLHGFHGLSWNYKIDINKAITIDSQPIKQICELTNKYSCGISFGYIEKYNRNIYCSNIIIDNNGNIVDNYRRISEGWKSNWSDPRYSEGKAFRVFEWQGKRMATAICGDLWWEQHLKDMEMLSKNLDAILWPLYIDYTPEAWVLSARQEYSDRVASIQSPILMINSYSEETYEAKGGCCVFRKGRIEKELPIGEKGVLTVDI